MGRKKVRARHTCEQCGKQREVTPSQKAKARWCSFKCRKAWYDTKYPKTEYTCLQCGKVGTTLRGKKFCDQKCYRLYTSKRKKEMMDKSKSRLKAMNENREFSDMTLTLVASAEMSGNDINKYVIDLCNWDENRFYQQLKINRKYVELRKLTIMLLRSK